MEFSGDLQTEGHTDQRSRVSLEVLGQEGWVQVPDLERYRVRLSQHQKDMKRLNQHEAPLRYLLTGRWLFSLTEDLMPFLPQSMQPANSKHPLCLFTPSSTWELHLEN